MSGLTTPTKPTSAGIDPVGEAVRHQIAEFGTRVGPITTTRIFLIDTEASQQDVKRIDLQLEVNLRGSILVTRAALPHLRASRGLVVNVASIAGTVPVPLLPVYAATKAGVISLTRSLNAALDADGVRVHALCPAFVATPMASFTGMQSDEMIQPEDCAEVVRMLLRLSPRARVPQVVIERLGAGDGVA